MFIMVCLDFVLFLNIFEEYKGNTFQNVQFFVVLTLQPSLKHIIPEGRDVHQINKPNATLTRI